MKEKMFFRLILLTIIFVANISNIFAQSGDIVGLGTSPAEAIGPFSTQTYTYDVLNEDGGDIRWSILGSETYGTINSFTETEVEIEWSAPAGGSVILQIEREDLDQAIEENGVIIRKYIPLDFVTIHFVDCPVVTAAISLPNHPENEVKAGETVSVQINGVPTGASVSWELIGAPASVTPYGAQINYTFDSDLSSGTYTFKATVVDVCLNEYEFLQPVEVTDDCYDNATLLPVYGIEICLNTNTLLQLNNAQVDAYTWSSSEGASVVETNSLDQTLTVTFSSSGQQEIRGVPNNTDCLTEVTFTRNISGPIESVVGDLMACQNLTKIYKVTGGDYDNGVVWIVPAGVVIQPLNGSNTEVALTFNNVGVQNINLSNPISSCTIGDYNFSVTVLEQVEKVSDVTLSNTNLTANNASPIPTELTTNTCLDLYADCGTLLSQVDAYLRFSLGADNYFTESSDVLAGIQFNISALDFEGNILYQEEGVNLSLYKLEPTKVYHLRLSGEDAANVRKFQVTPVANSYTTHADIDAEKVTLQFFYEEVSEIDASRALLELVYPGTDPLSGSFEHTFEWEVKASEYSCREVPGYQVQMMRIYGDQTLATLTASDWRGATNMFSESPETDLMISIAEGSGNYVWRVRPVGTLLGEAKYALSNPANWDDNYWVSGSFTFTQPDEDKNFIYSRTFTEKGKVNETLGFANGLGQVAQQQVKLHGTTGEIIATQTLQDYVGRNALSTLPVPLQDISAFGYRNSVLSNGTGTYSEGDFDLDPKNAGQATVYGDYYGGSIPGVADAQGVPYARTLFTNDGSGRVKEQAGVGATHALTADRATTRTTRTYYSSVDEGELVTIFGIEAPDAKNVHKIITYDANNVGSVTYQDKSGKVIATALDAGAVAQGLDLLDSTPDANGQTILSNITGNTRKGAYQVNSQKPLFFTSPKVVTINYGITPATASEICSQLCSSCDYLIEFILYNTDDPTAPAELLGSHTIAPGTCATNGITNLPTITETLQGETNYILERRISTHQKNPTTGLYYLDEQLGEISTHYSSVIDAVVTGMQSYIDADDPEGLYAHLESQGYTLDLINDQYAIPLVFNAGDATCTEYLFIPHFDLCSAGTPDADCKIDGMLWEAYFQNYWTERGEDFGELVDGKLSFVYFEDLYQRSIGAQDLFYYAPGELDQMIQSLKEDNADRLTCDDIWGVWKQEVAVYKSYVDFESIQDPSPSPLGIPLFTNNLVERFFSGLEALLDQKKPEGAEDVCEPATDGSLTYMVRDLLYGEINGTSYPSSAQYPDLKLEAHRLVYLNTAQSDPNGASGDDLLRALAEIPTTTPVAISHFEGLTACNKYKLHKLTDGFAGASEVNEDEEQSRLVSACGQMCEDRSEEFKQAVVNKLFVRNANYLIQNHRVSFNAALGEFIAVYDETVNTDTYDYSTCELELMVNGLVENCKTNYCSFDIQTQNGEFSGLGTNEQIENLEKVFNYDFAIQLNEQGQVCASDWDQINTNGISADDAFTQLWTVNDLDGTCATSQEVISTFDAQGNIYALLTTRSGKFSYTLNNGMEIKDESGTGKFAIVKFNTQGAYLWHNEYEFELQGDVSTTYNAPQSLPMVAPVPGSLSTGDTQLIEDVSMTVNANGDISFIANIYTESGLVASSTNWKLKHGNVVVLEFDTSYNSDVQYCSTSYVFNFVAAAVSSSGDDKWFRNYAASYTNFNPFDEQGNAYVLRRSGIPMSIEKIAPNGDLLWVTETVDLLNNVPITLNSGEISRDAQGNIYFFNVYTTTTSAADLTVSNQVVATLPASSRTAVLMKFDDSGAFSWVHTIPTVNPDYKKILARNDHVLLIDKVNTDLVVQEVYSPTNIQQYTVNGVPELGSFSLLPLSGDQLMIYNPRTIDEGINSITVNLSDYSFSSDFDLTQSQAIGLADVHLSLGVIKNYIGYTGSGSVVNGYLVPTGGFLAPANILTPLLCSTFDPGQTVSNATHTVAVDKLSFPTICFQWTTERASEITLSGDDDFIFNPTFTTSCESVQMDEIRESIAFQKESIINQTQEAYKETYASNCVDPDLFTDDFTISYSIALHHYTLYYYDRAGNLLTTVPPEGVITLDVSDLNELETAKGLIPAHGFQTKYYYNSQGQLLGQKTPDAGKTFFIYNDVGQLRFSQNAKQKGEGTYSYTHYDALARITEVGLASGDFNITARANRNELAWPTGGTEVTRTVYNTPYPDGLPAGYSQSPFLRNRISYVYIDPDGVEDPENNDRVTTIYSYDPHGNVEWLVQDVPGLGQKTIDYSYDLLSGNVLQVAYNKGERDQFYHRYEYDQDSRIVAVETSPDGVIWDIDAKYKYYAHGPLKKVLIGHDKVQQQDYLYTIHGWLKSINDPATAAGPNTATARDAFAMVLHYYSGDYTHDSGTVGKLTAAEGRDLYNGNISAWENANQNKTGIWTRSGMQYTYDALNRIKKSKFNVYRKETNDGPGEVAVDAFFRRKSFATKYTYDGNGNLKTLTRDDFDGERMDQLVYSMEEGRNRLASVLDDSGIAPEKHPNDIEGTNNYIYDAIGNLITDEGSGVNIDWTVYGKVRATSKVTQPGVGTSFIYDATGNRVAKQSTDVNGKETTDYYVRDASGNVMAIYKAETTAGEDQLSLEELPIYGSDRIGMYKPGLNLSDGAVPLPTDEPATYRIITDDEELSAYEGIAKYYLTGNASMKLLPGFDTNSNELNVIFADIPQPNLSARKLDARLYELKDHLGNIRATVSDIKQEAPEGEAGFISTVVSSMDYYPFGMDRTPVVWEAVEYLATFETDNEADELTGFQDRSAAVIVNTDIYNNTPDTPERDAINSQLLTGEEGHVFGLSKFLPIQAGDKVSMEVYGKYTTTANNNPYDITASLVGNLLNQLPISAGELQAAGLQTSIVDEFVDIGRAGLSNLDGVSAYLNYLLLDKNFNFVSAGYQMLPDNADVDHQQLAMELVPEQDGYVYIYLSNESQQLTNVYFDDLRVTHEVLIKDPQLETYRYGFNGKEKDSKGEFGLNHYDYGFRIYNPAIAKFLSVDPLTASYPWYTPYQFAGNMPIVAIDIDGLEELNVASIKIINRVNAIKMTQNQINMVLKAAVEKMAKLEVEYSLENNESIKQRIVQQRVMGHQLISNLLHEDRKLVNELRQISTTLEIVGEGLDQMVELTEYSMIVTSVLSGGASSGFRGMVVTGLEEFVFLKVGDLASGVIDLASPHELGNIGEEATEAALREKFPDGQFFTQVKGKFTDGKFTAFDFLVTDDNGKVVAAVEAKANTAGLTKNQRRFFRKGESITLFGSAAEEAGLAGVSLNPSKIGTFLSRSKISRVTKELISNTIKAIKQLK